MQQIPSGEHQFACDELCDVLKFNFRWAERDDLYPITRLAVEIDSRSGLVIVPDIAVLNTKPIGRVFTPDQVVLVAEVWTADDSVDERTRAFDLYARAEIRYFWTADLDEPSVNAYEFLGDSWYRLRDTLSGREIDRIEAAPVPVSIQPAQLVRRERAQPTNVSMAANGMGSQSGRLSCS
ncbi:MAG TPA: Uma2 family endonuclease [Pseudonocardiaceae bacterium]|jgi:hypothetical protein|nr:Uma2 family endonuclease [Pseudonocardiaceae bacterium]